jgi:hypothetical protein
MEDENLAILYTQETREHNPCSLGERGESLTLLTSLTK